LYFSTIVQFETPPALIRIGGDRFFSSEADGEPMNEDSLKVYMQLIIGCGELSGNHLNDPWVLYCGERVSSSPLTVFDA
jgi:hypothetical protein